jgi:hypothetical protein
MILGLSIAAFTLLHVIISLIAITSGIIVLIGMLGSRRLPGWTALFLLTTILTSVTGFLFPIHGFTAALGTGIYSLIVLAIALLALYGKHLMGAWRWIYVVAALAALHANILVLIAQAFLKIPLLHPLAPMATNEPPFLIAQTVLLVLMVVAGILALIKFRPGLAPAH